MKSIAAQYSPHPCAGTAMEDGCGPRFPFEKSPLENRFSMLLPVVGFSAKRRGVTGASKVIRSDSMTTSLSKTSSRNSSRDVAIVSSLTRIVYLGSALGHLNGK